MTRLGNSRPNAATALQSLNRFPARSRICDPFRWEAAGGRVARFARGVDGGVWEVDPVDGAEHGVGILLLEAQLDLDLLSVRRLDEHALLVRPFVADVAAGGLGTLDGHLAVEVLGRDGLAERDAGSDLVRADEGSRGGAVRGRCDALEVPLAAVGSVVLSPRRVVPLHPDPLTIRSLHWTDVSHHRPGAVGGLDPAADVRVRGHHHRGCEVPVSLGSVGPYCARGDVVNRGTPHLLFLNVSMCVRSDEFGASGARAIGADDGAQGEESDRGGREG